tara:strand:+ start:187 stop:855 length:669 start_codon:yes stop_codon:yes gene_type:complete
LPWEFLQEVLVKRFLPRVVAAIKKKKTFKERSGKTGELEVSESAAFEQTSGGVDGAAEEEETMSGAPAPANKSKAKKANADTDAVSSKYLSRKEEAMYGNASEEEEEALGSEDAVFMGDTMEEESGEGNQGNDEARKKVSTSSQSNISISKTANGSQKNVSRSASTTTLDGDKALLNSAAFLRDYLFSQNGEGMLWQGSFMVKMSNAELMTSELCTVLSVYS